LHNTLWAQAASDARAAGRSGYDFHRLLASVRTVVSAADVAICHLETPIGQPAGPFTGYPVFTVPPQIIPAIADTGYDSCSTASNHSLDAGEQGIQRTLSALDAAGLAHAGTARSVLEHNTPTIINVHGVMVAHLSYTFSFNGIARPAGKPWLANDLAAAAVLGEARRARTAGAEIVIVSAHWGTEYSQAASSGQTALARRLLASPDIDLVLGHHAHVVQPFERIGDKWVVYGMGNEVASQPQRETTQDGVLARMTFQKVADHRWRVVTAEALPTMMDLDGTARLVLVPTALGNRGTSATLREACLRSLARTTAALTARGALTAGLVIRDRRP
jgi:poly-gamma-glutamate capsule biosynthesis protein CapA/YwtB (metallophosphatase superfamily)